jgi:hypothetical protein
MGVSRVLKKFASRVDRSYPKFWAVIGDPWYQGIFAPKLAGGGAKGREEHGELGSGLTGARAAT